MAVKWEPHDELEDGLQSVCGTFEIHTDPVYGYLCLYRSEDTCEALGVSLSVRELTRLAEALPTIQEETAHVC